MFFKLLLVLIFQFLFEIDPCYSQRFDLPTLPPPKIVTQNCTQLSTSKVFWFRFSSGDPNCYYISLLYSTLNWFAANDKCRTLGSSLVSIHDYNTDYLLSHRNISEPSKYNEQVFWTGLNSLSKRGVYKWTDNSPVQYTNYTNVTSKGDPIPLNLLDQGRCVSLKSLANGSTNDTKYQGALFKDDCFIHHRYICQRNPSVSTVPTPPPTPVGNCPSDWFQYANQKCIKYMNVSMTFNQSRDLCVKTNGGEMLSIHSKEEQIFITAYTADLHIPYIGLVRRTNVYPNWHWDDSKQTDFTYWGMNSYHENQNCAIIITNDTQPGKWLPTNCNGKNSVICEKPLDPSITTPGQTFATNKCKIPGFANFIQYRNSCYSVLDSGSNKSLSYSDAEKSCQAMKGSHLVSIVDQSEESFLRYLIKQFGKSGKYWIGLESKHYGKDQHRFEWSDDWPLYYTNWDKHEPKFAGIPHEKCVTFAKSNGTWRTTPCSSKSAYVCKTTTNQLPKMNSDKSGVCPTLKNVTDMAHQWVDIDKRSQYCYWFSLDKNTASKGAHSWDDASFHCRQRNGTLVSIHSKHDSLLLKEKVSFTGMYYKTWIGLSTDPDGDYVWEDGSALDYTNWAPNEKLVTKTDLNKDESNRQCAEVNPWDPIWKQTSCSGSKINYYICGIRKIYHPHVTTKSTGQTTSKRPINNTTPYVTVDF